jgi:hypothetical protein
MLNGITWKQFLEGAALLSIGYYAVIILLYYRKELTGILQRQPLIGAQPDSTGVVANHDPLLPQVHELVTAIKNVLYAAASQQYAWNETIFALQQLLKEYPQVHGSRFTVSINNEITHLSNEILGIPVTDEELQSLWVA